MVTQHKVVDARTKAQTSWLSAWVFGCDSFQNAGLDIHLDDVNNGVVVRSH